MSGKRTPRKSPERHAVRKMVSMSPETWELAEEMADESGMTRSGVVAEAIENLAIKRKLQKFVNVRRGNGNAF